jgi:NTE family protein
VDLSYSPPGTADILLKARSTPIDAFSYETIESLKDTAARWATMRLIRNSAAFAANKDPRGEPPPLRVSRQPRCYADRRIGSQHCKDMNDFDYLNRQRDRRFAWLEPEAVDRSSCVPRAEGTITHRTSSLSSSGLLMDLGARAVESKHLCCWRQQ